MSQTIRVKVMTHKEFVEWRGGEGFKAPEDIKALVRETGIAPLTFSNCGEGTNNFYFFVCPGCGHRTAGNIGDVAIGGWEKQQWTVEGDNDHLTLRPSIGCPRWTEGACIGHWWITNGEVVLA